MKRENHGKNVTNTRNKEHFLEIQRHPYPPFVPEGAKILILGSTPPARFCAEAIKPLHAKDVDWYYGSYYRSHNMLWEILFRVMDPDGLPELDRIRDLQTEREAKTHIQREFLQAWLSRNNLGMLDMLARFERRDGSASDARLNALEFTDLISPLRLNPSIQAVCCTSRHRVFEWLKQYLAAQGIAMKTETAEYSFRLPDFRGQTLFPQGIKALVLPSPSPVGRIRHPSHEAWLEHLVNEYRRLFAPVINTV